MKLLEPYYRVGEPFIYSHAKTMMALATTFAFNEPHLPKAVWELDAAGADELVYQGQRFKTNCIGLAVENALAKAMHVLETELVKDPKLLAILLPKFDPKIIIDDLTNNTNGYSFLDPNVNPVFADVENILLEYLLKKVGDIEEGQQQAFWNKWCKAVKRFLHHLFVAFHLSSGLPGRGGEVCGLLFENTEVRTRNLFHIFGGLVVIHQYNKTSHNRGIEKTVAKKLYPPVSDLLLLYLTVIRPIELRAAPQVLALRMIKDTDRDRILDDLCSKIWASATNGEFSSQSLSNGLATIFRGLTKANMNLLEYRHLAIILMRKLIKHHGLQADQIQQFQAIMDLTAGHAHNTSEVHYGMLSDQMVLDMTDSELLLSVGVRVAVVGNTLIQLTLTPR